MTWMLGIGTSHHVAIGLTRDGESIVSEAVAGTHAHGEALTPLIQRPCVSAGIVMTGIDAYAVDMGPGPFMGLCTGIVTARTLTAAAGRPLYGVCPPDVIAAQRQDAPDEFVATSGARREEFYRALYRDGIRAGEPRVSASGAIPGLPAVGPVPDDSAGPRHLDATVLVARRADLPSVDGGPFHLRVADAAVPGTRKSALSCLRAPR